MRAWCVGERTGVLQRLIGNYKFQNMRGAHRALGDLLLESLPHLPANTVIIPIPTVSSHVRQRGYDHMLLIARYIAKKRGLKMIRVLGRKTMTRQRQANRSDRIMQAKHAFKAHGKISGDVPYLLIDDVVTTGATMRYAARALQEAGASEIWVAAIARQPLD